MDTLTENEIDVFWQDLDKLKMALLQSSPESEKWKENLITYLVHHFWASVLCCLRGDGLPMTDCDGLAHEFFIWLRENLHLLPYTSQQQGGINTAVVLSLQQWAKKRPFKKKTIPCAVPSYIPAHIRASIIYFINIYHWSDPLQSVVLYTWLLRHRPLRYIAAIWFQNDMDLAWETLQQASDIWRREWRL